MSHHEVTWSKASGSVYLRVVLELLTSPSHLVWEGYFGSEPGLGKKHLHKKTLFNVQKRNHPPELHALNYRSLYEALHCLLISHKFSTPTLTSLMKDPMCKESIHTISKHHCSLEMPKTTTPP